MRYYVYTHAIPNGSVFYVGKGQRGRAFSNYKRSPAWRGIVDQYAGLTIHIVSYYETEKEAYAAEKMLIKKYRNMGARLVNIADGGPGPLGYVQSESARLKKQIQMTGYKHKTITCPHCNLSGGETSMKRWHFEKCTGLKMFKARATINGKRVFLGNYATKEDANNIAEKFKAELT
ncbi:hypothetical protein UFOVP1417_64 [uncultured Caudovirales phage]|uniref:Homing endonuclease n=1 Tax=uncultured Caudovirales phage TaxID=2100421 RepID=A0A6J7X7D3_9CAUD|nr:hypothetical protein UFOVP664_23 [uncultured Caudovirales phage]CAB4196296.1 hypothetical protein UFOVP1303_71 [uncultured Caudovirales phage]CAB4211008.1 hypothetical protein UFOVP1417_64 [uncultured Caudovirales phage]CAB5226830.1 hypothetical protein UFOVP1517_47 [uncultured Caudovirales phage]